MNITTTCLTLALLLLPAFGLAREPAGGSSPVFVAEQSLDVTATVTAIDMETREVTLRGPEGNAISIVADEEVRNLASMKVGDTVEALYVERMSLEIIGDAAAAASEGILQATGRTEPGDRPGMMAAEARVIVATIVAIDRDAHTFELQSADGSVREFTARNPANLDLASVGDLLRITASQSVAIAVRPSED